MTLGGSFERSSGKPSDWQGFDIHIVLYYVWEENWPRLYWGWIYTEVGLADWS
jgi:hypothetical protein